MCALAHQAGRHWGELVSHLIGKAQNLLWDTGSFMLVAGASVKTEIHLYRHGWIKLAFLNDSARHGCGAVRFHGHAQGEVVVHRLIWMRWFAQANMDSLLRQAMLHHNFSRQTLPAD